MKAKKLIVLMLVLTLVFSLTACGGDSSDSDAGAGDAEPIKWTMSSIYQEPVGDAKNQNLSAGMKHFIEQVNERSEGRLVIEGYYNGLLGNANDTFQQMERGEVDVYYGQPMSTIDPAFGVWNTPFLFTNYEDVREVACDPEGEFFEYSASLFESHNAVLLANGVGSMRGLVNAKHEVGPIEDVRDLKLRIYEDDIVNAFWKEICNAIPMPIGDVYTSLQTNAVDGLEFTPDSIISMKFHEVATYYSDINWQWANNACFVVNADAYEALPEDLQQLVTEIAWEASNVQADQAIVDYEDAMTSLKTDYGVEIHLLTDEERQTWIDYAETKANEFRETVGEENYDKIMEMAKK